MAEDTCKSVEGMTSVVQTLRLSGIVDRIKMQDVPAVDAISIAGFLLELPSKGRLIISVYELPAISSSTTPALEATAATSTIRYLSTCLLRLTHHSSISSQ
jgi:hypothetical protein